MSSLVYGGWALWLLGYPEQALKSSYEAMTLAQALSHPYGPAYALTYAAMLHQSRREGHPAQDRAEAEQGFPHWLAVGH